MNKRVEDMKTRIINPLKEIYGKLTKSQRMSLGILTGIIVFAFALLLTNSQSSQDWVMVGKNSENPDLMQFLMSKGIENKLTGEGYIQVREQDQSKLEQDGFKAMLANPEDSSYAWLFDANGWQDSNASRRAKMDQTSKENLEKAIVSLEGVAAASVFIKANPGNSYSVIQSNRKKDSASVMIKLHGKKKLAPDKAITISNIIEGGFNISREMIKISDNYGNNYDVNNELANSGSYKKDIEKDFTSKIEKLLRGSLSDEQFVVQAVVTLSRAVSKITQTSYDPNIVSAAKQESNESRETKQAIPHAPGTETNVSDNNAIGQGVGGSNGDSEWAEKYSRTETLKENHIGMTRTETRDPALQIQAYNATVNVSIDGIRRTILGMRKTLEDTNEKITAADIEQYKTDLKGQLLALIPVKLQSESTLQISHFIPQEIPVMESKVSDTVFAYVGEFYRELVLGFLALVASVLVYRVAFRTVPALDELPDQVVELSEFLKEREEEERIAAESKTDQDELEQVIDWEMDEEDKEKVALLDRVSKFAGERPDVASSVLRVWMRDAPVSHPMSGDLEDE